MEKPPIETESSLEKLERVKKYLNEFLQCCSDLPDNFIIDPGNTGYRDYKFRSNWFQGVFSASKFVARFFGDEDLKKHIDALAQKRRLKDKQSKTTREEINEADELIFRVLKLLETPVTDRTTGE